MELMQRWERKEALRRHGWKEAKDGSGWYKPSKNDRPNGLIMSLYSIYLPLYHRDWAKIRKDFPENV